MTTCLSQALWTEEQLQLSTQTAACRAGHVSPAMTPQNAKQGCREGLLRVAPAPYNAPCVQLADVAAPLSGPPAAASGQPAPSAPSAPSPAVTTSKLVRATRASGRSVRALCSCRSHFTQAMASQTALSMASERELGLYRCGHICMAHEAPESLVSAVSAGIALSSILTLEACASPRKSHLRPGRGFQHWML